MIKRPLTADITRLETNYDNILAFGSCHTFLKDTVIICAYIPHVDSPYYSDKETPCNITLLEDLVMKFQETFS